MGFKCGFEMGLRDGKSAESGDSAVGMLEEAGRERVTKLQRGLMPISQNFTSPVLEALPG